LPTFSRVYPNFKLDHNYYYDDVLAVSSKPVHKTYLFILLFYHIIGSDWRWGWWFWKKQWLVFMSRSGVKFNSGWEKTLFCGGKNLWNHVSFTSLVLLLNLSSVGENIEDQTYCELCLSVRRSFYHLWNIHSYILICYCYLLCFPNVFCEYWSRLIPALAMGQLIDSERLVKQWFPPWLWWRGERDHYSWNA